MVRYVPVWMLGSLPWPAGPACVDTVRGTLSLSFPAAKAGLTPSAKGHMLSDHRLEKLCLVEHAKMFMRTALPITGSCRQRAITQAASRMKTCRLLTACMYKLYGGAAGDQAIRDQSGADRRHGTTCSSS